MTTLNGQKPTTPTENRTLHEKLDELLEFQRQLQPYLPLLEKLAAFVDNPAARFRTSVLRKGRS